MLCGYMLYVIWMHLKDTLCLFSAMDGFFKGMESLER